MSDGARKGEPFASELSAVRQRIAGLGHIVGNSHKLMPIPSLQPRLREILATAADLTDSEEVSILLRDIDTGELHFSAAFGATSEELLEGGVPVPIAGSIAGTILTSQEPLNLADVRSDPRLCMYKEIGQQTGFEARTLLGVPLQLGDQSAGVLLALNKRGDQAFSKRDVETLAALVTHAALAIENAQLHQEAMELADQLKDWRERTEELGAAIEELDAWAQTVTHDLNNLLGLIIGYSEVLAEDFDAIPGEEARRYLHAIARSGRKISYMINELLLLSATRETKVKLKMLDMGSIVDEALQRLAFMIETHQAEIILPDAWPGALGYGPWVEEVWANYVSNAIKYGGQPPRVELGATVPTDRGTVPTDRDAPPMVHFRVHDNGAGLTPDEQTRLFTPFTRLDQVRIQGYGLGLSIVRRIVERLGGKVGVESKMGEGSTFSFSLPFAE